MRNIHLAFPHIKYQKALSAVCFFAVLFFFCGCSIPAASQSVTVKTNNGYVGGTREKNILVFKGIPYAKPPVGSLRFKAPQPADQWKDTLSCRQFGNIASQYSGSKKGATGSEDCLSLNVYTPFTSGKTKLPIVVWVHGGAMTSGAGKGMDGHAFADQDSIITVTINYRLGVFGFLYMGDQHSGYRNSGNNGLLDCIMALKWIRQNISSFGGDASKVTVMGESAGAKLVSTLLVSPLAKGYFSQLILESGAVQCIRDSTTAKNIRQRLLDTLQLNSPAALLKLSTAQLIDAQNKVCSGAQGTNYFGPVQDGEVITEDPYQYLKQRPDRHVRLLIGTNSAESRIFMNADKRLYQPDQKVLRDWFGNNSPYVSSALGKPIVHPDNISPVITLFTQYMYQMHTYRLAEVLAANDTPFWMYRFDYSRNHSGANHGQELDYVWFSDGKRSFNPEEVQLARQIHLSWVNFIKGGNPGPVSQQEWPLYRKNNKTIMVFDRVAQPEQLKEVYNDPDYPSSGFVLN
ncbi:carboxylesterase/lipase family protein [Pedobacter hartonius]|uniref:Carboxylic ester hydrolase n=1 Tax=Pedobacter hartonius TaxID=425514 RepID=A0A1H4BH07_9SPHI|nr:carboxylesterase family protein [Pedobacter hartonius]SEA47459.1 para-nitrobenzyl esterase [Pedobacter hartonius]